MILAALAYVSSVYSCPGESIDHRNFIFLQVYPNMPLVYAYKIFGQYDVYFLSGSHFAKVRNVALLLTSLSLEP